jgi:DNA-directed RNA polymerase specialized sigma24 family protein
LPSDDRLAIPQAGPSTMLDRERTAAIVRVAADGLEAPYGEVVRLRLGGLEPREIAAQLGVCDHTIRSRLGRGLARLRVRLVEVFGGDPRISGS